LADSLVDTNVLVYAADPRDRAKQTTAAELLEGLIATQRAVLSVQCLTEFYSVVTRRLRDPIAPREALGWVEQFAGTCRVLDLTGAVALEGLRACTRYGLSPWDALIWAVAKLNQIPYVLTEDAEHGRVLEGVRYLNPFHSAFDPRVLSA
jgi:predicted nucleic acid-binding protein